MPFALMKACCQLAETSVSFSKFITVEHEIFVIFLTSCPRITKRFHNLLLPTTSGVIDGGVGVRAAPPGKLNVKNGPLRDFTNCGM